MLSLSSAGPLLSYRDASNMLGAPAYVADLAKTDVFVAAAEDTPQAIVYSVPAECEFRLATSPLHAVRRVDGRLTVDWQLGVDPKFAIDSPLRSMEVQV